MAEPFDFPAVTTYAPTLPAAPAPMAAPAPTIPAGLVAPPEQALPVPVFEEPLVPSAVPAGLVAPPEEVALPPLPPEIAAAGVAGEARAGVERAAEQAVDVEPAETAAARLAKFGDQKNELTGKLADLAGRAAMTQDPAELAKLRKEYQRVQAAKGMIDQAMAAARPQAEATAAVLAQQVANKQQAIQEAGLRAADAEADLLREEADAKTRALQAEQATVRDRHEREKAEYRELLETGPETKTSDWVAAVARVIGEGLNAAVDRRPPSFDRIFADLDKQVQRRFQGQISAATQAITDTGDALGDLAAQQKEVEASRAAGEAAVRRKVAADIRVKAEQAAEPLQKLALARLADDVDRQAEAKEAQAMAARAEQQRKARMDAAKLAEMEAKTTLTRAQTTKAMAEAEKAARRARGQGRSEKGDPTVDPQLARLTKGQRARVEKLGIRHPYTGGYLKLAADPGRFLIAPERKVAEAIQNRVIATTDFLAVGAEMADVMERAGWELDALASGDWQKIKVLQTKLTTIIKSSEQLGALDAGALEFAKAFTTAGLDATGFRSALPALKKSMELQAGSANREITGRGGSAIRFPVPTLERDPLSAAQRAAGKAIHRGDQTGVAGAYDKFGEADSARKTAALARADLKASTDVVRLLAQGQTGMPAGLRRFAPQTGAVSPAIRALAQKSLKGKLTADEERRLVAEIEKRKPELAGRVFVGAGGRVNQRTIARAQDRKASAITLAQEWFQKGTPIEQFSTARLVQAGRIDGVDLDNPRELAEFRRQFQAEYERVSGGKLKGKGAKSKARKRAKNVPAGLDLSALAR